MANSIISSIAALNAQSSVSRASNDASASIARLSSGNRINKASDDVAGLATGTALRTQVTTLRQALANASQGTSLLQVADGGLSQIVDILQRQKAIATQASSGQLTDANRSLLNQEFTNLTAEIDRIAGSTNFNGVKLLAGGLGTSASLANTDALAAAFVPTAAAGSNAGTAVASTKAIQAFNIQTGALLNTAAAATTGKVDITDSAGTILSDSAFLNVNSAVGGQFSNFQISNVVYGGAGTGSATVSAVMNGVTFTGNYAAGGTTIILGNGTTYMKLTTTALTLTNAGTVQNAQAQLGTDFANTVIQRVSQIQGVDFSGTRLAGAAGAAATGISEARLSSSTAVISDFRYTGNTGAANTSTMSVQINGKTFVATGVKDVPTGKIVFQSDDAQVFTVDITGITTAFTGQNIRTDLSLQASFVNALNTGFSRAGSGLNFSVGSATTDTIKVALTSASSNSLYGGQTLSVGSAAAATAASAALDVALTSATSLRASVGALQSRFNFASNAVQAALENQDSARSAILDTDVAAESSSYAASQVQLQAGISVLAQANQQMQNLLKLIQ